jgi:hypothetical protein
MFDKVVTHGSYYGQRIMSWIPRPIEEQDHMPTANRLRSRRDYMRDYRAGNLRRGVAGKQSRSARREKLKQANRLDTFKWRLSKLLSPQYEILLCVEYPAVYGVFEDDEGRIMGCNQHLVHDSKVIMRYFPILKEEFRYLCDIGGGELFKVFLLWKYSRKFDQVTQILVGALDKAALLENLQKLPNQGGTKWKPILDKVKTEWGQGTWRKLDFSEGLRLWVGSYIMCYLLKCTARERPKWGSLRFYSHLLGWTLSSRKRGSGEKYEWPKANHLCPRRLIRSPILWCDEYWLRESRDDVAPRDPHAGC